MDLGIALEGSTGQTSLFRTRRHQAETTPLQKARRLLPSKRCTASKSLIPSTGIITSMCNLNLTNQTNSWNFCFWCMMRVVSSNMGHHTGVQGPISAVLHVVENGIIVSRHGFILFD